MKKNKGFILKMPDELEAEFWRRDLSGACTNEITKQILSAEEFEKYQWSDSGVGKMLIINPCTLEQ